MTRWLWVSCLAGGTLAALSGCGGLWGDQSTVFMVGVDDEQVFYQYYEVYSGWVTVPSSLWKVDLETEAATRLQDPVCQFGLQAEGDFYVSEEELDDGRKGRIVAVRISTGDRTVLHERELAVSNPTIHILDGQRVTVLTDDGLLFIDLADETRNRTFQVSEDTRELVAFSDDRVVITRGADLDSQTAMLINLATDEVLDIPPAPGNRQPFYNDAQLSDTWLAVSRWEQFDERTSRSDALALHIPTQSWRVLAEYDPFDVDTFAPPVLFVRGVDDTRVLVEYRGLNAPFGDGWIELIELETGERHVIDEHSGLLAFDLRFPWLLDGRVYWIDSLLNSIVVYDIASEARRLVPLPLLGES